MAEIDVGDGELAILIQDALDFLEFSCSAVGKNEITGKSFVIVEKESPESLAFVPQTQYEVFVTIMRVILHQVPHYRGIESFQRGS